MKFFLIAAVFFLLGFFGAAYSAYAQPTDPGGGGVPGVPISGLEVLLGLGGLYGAKKAHEIWKRKR